MCAVGAAVDFSRVNSTRTAFQGALDSTAPTLTKYAQYMDQGALSTKATDLFGALFTRPEAYDIAIQATLTSSKPGSFDLTISGPAKVDAIFGYFLDKPQIPMSASSTVEWGIKKLNLALVLDNTGSMGSSGKMNAIKARASGSRSAGCRWSVADRSSRRRRIRTTSTGTSSSCSPMA
jgi:hypothetical protein